MPNIFCCHNFYKIKSNHNFTWKKNNNDQELRFNALHPQVGARLQVSGAAGMGFNPMAHLRNRNASNCGF